MDYMSRPSGYMTAMDDRDKNIATAMTVIQNFERQAVNGGKLELEIDRYGHIKCVVTINPNTGRSVVRTPLL